MAEASAKEGAQDPSMEEILQSIRQIIAEDGDEAKPAANGTPAADASSVLELSNPLPAEEPPLELTPAMQEPTPPTLESAAPAPQVPPANDVLSAIDTALEAAPPPPPAPPPPAAEAASAPASPPPAPSADALLSAQAATTASASIKKLQAAVEPPLPGAMPAASPTFQSGNTVEAMVNAMLRPMIKDWLDKNLPGIVERLVAAEIRRLTK